MKLIVGLGNPGEKYSDTRHNLGFAALDECAKVFGAEWKNDGDRKSLIAKTDVSGTSVILAKPQTFMNKSGDAVLALSGFYKIEPEDLLIIHDELDLEPGRIQIKSGGNAAGHNGVSSIQERLGTTEIARLRLGIGHPEHAKEKDNYVLSKLSPEDTPNLLDVSRGVRDWIEHGVEFAANRWNSTNPK